MGPLAPGGFRYARMQQSAAAAPMLSRLVLGVRERRLGRQCRLPIL